MKKIITLNIFKNCIDVYDNVIHVGDEEVVYVKGNFNHSFYTNLNDVKLELMVVSDKINETFSTFIKDNKFELALSKKCSKYKSILNCQLRLSKDKKILYLNDTFKIKVVKEWNVSCLQNINSGGSNTNIEELVEDKVESACDKIDFELDESGNLYLLKED